MHILVRERQEQALTPGAIQHGCSLFANGCATSSKHCLASADWTDCLKEMAAGWKVYGE